MRLLRALDDVPRVVAVDTTSKHPPETLKDRTSVGYMRALSTEGALSTKPTVILASKSAGPPEVVAALKASSVPYVEVSDDDSPEAVAEKVRFLAQVTRMETEGEALARRVACEFDALAVERGKIAKKGRALVVLSLQSGRAIVGGKGSSADVILRLAGAENAAQGVDGFKPVVDEAAVELAPDVIVFLQRAGSDAGKEELLKLKWLKATPAGAARRIIEMDAASAGVKARYQPPRFRIDGKDHGGLPQVMCLPRRGPLGGGERRGQSACDRHASAVSRATSRK